MASLKEINKSTMVVTSKYVIEDNMPILCVSKDDDEEGGFDLQFHCGNDDYSMEKMLLVSLDTILKLDNTLFDLELEIGQEATRLNKNSNWIIKIT